MTLRQQRPVAPRVFHQAPARLDEALLEAGQRPTLDAPWQHQPPPQVAQVVREHASGAPRASSRMLRKAKVGDEILTSTAKTRILVGRSEPNGLHEAVKALRETYPEATPGEKSLLVILDFLQIIGSTEEGADPGASQKISRVFATGCRAPRRGSDSLCGTVPAPPAPPSSGRSCLSSDRLGRVGPNAPAMTASDPGRASRHRSSCPHPTRAGPRRP